MNENYYEELTDKKLEFALDEMKRALEEHQAAMETQMMFGIKGYEQYEKILARKRLVDKSILRQEEEYEVRRKLKAEMIEKLKKL